MKRAREGWERGWEACKQINFILYNDTFENRCRLDKKITICVAAHEIRPAISANLFFVLKFAIGSGLIVN